MLLIAFRLLGFRGRSLPLLLGKLLIAGVVACSAGTGATSLVEMPPGATEAAFRRLLQEADVPGGVLVIQPSRGEPQTWVAGVRSLTRGEPVTAGDCFYIGSLTKTYVATIVLQLVAEGRLDLDGKLADHLPDIPRADSITLRQLMNHTAGMEGAYIHLYYLPIEEMRRSFAAMRTPDDLIGLGVGLPHRFDPGTDYYYSGTHYDVLAKVIESVTGETLENELRSRIIEPLGLEHTWMGFGRQPPDCLVTGHLGPTDFWEHSKTLYPELAPSTDLDEPMKAWAAGGMGSNAADVLAFGSALFGGELLPAHLLEEMTTFIDPRDVTQSSRQPQGFGYGLGLIHMSRETYRRIGHGGMYSGYTVGLWRIPELDSIVVLLLNRGLFFGERRLLDELVALLPSKPSAPSSR